MQVTKEQITSIARLARLEANNPEVVNNYINSLSKIIEIFTLLEEVNTEDVEPMISVSDFDQTMREDNVTDGNIEEIFSNAPKELYKHFAVPKVIE